MKLGLLLTLWPLSGMASVFLLPKPHPSLNRYERIGILITMLTILGFLGPVGLGYMIAKWRRDWELERRG